MNEQQLIEGLIEGTSRAIHHLCESYRGRILAAVRPRVRDEWDAEEVTQDTLLKVIRKIETFRGNSALWSWMYRIAVNEAKMKTRKYKRHPTPLESETLRALRRRESEGEFDERPDAHLATKELLEEIERYLEECTEKNTLIYLDLEFSDRDREEVADELELTPGAVKTRLHRTRVGLRERIEERYPIRPDEPAAVAIGR
ncbi:MAG: RNA polymerase sigma factor [Persicimonas sp.]